jgi:carbonic anhydrase
MSVFDDLLAGNARHAATFEHGRLPAPPARGLAVLTCMDARILPLEVFGLGTGDAHIIRNAGGRATDDVLRSVLVSVHTMGVRAIAVVHHTECGLTKVTDEGLRKLVTAATGHDPAPLPLAGSPLLPGIEVAGFRYDVRTGQLHLVVPAFGSPRTG